MYSVMLMRLHSGRRESATMRDGQQEVEIRVSRAAMDEGVHHILVDLPLRPVAPGGAEAEFVIEHPVLQGVRLLTRAAGVLGLLPGQVEIALLDLELAGALGGTRRFLHGLGKHLEQAGLLVNGHIDALLSLNRPEQYEGQHRQHSHTEEVERAGEGSQDRAAADGHPSAH